MSVSVRNCVSNLTVRAVIRSPFLCDGTPQNLILPQIRCITKHFESNTRKGQNLPLLLPKEIDI